MATDFERVDNLATEVVTEVSTAAHSIHPSMAVELGFHVFLEDHMEEGSTLHKTADATITRTLALFGEYTTGAAAMYVYTLQTVANGLAYQLGQETETFKHDINRVERDLEHLIRGQAMLKVMFGILKGAWRFILLAGIAGIGYAILAYVGISVKAEAGIEAESTTGALTSIPAIAFAVVLVAFGSVWEFYAHNKRSRKVKEQLQDDLTTVYDTYVENVTTIFAEASETAKEAWKEMTDVPLPHVAQAENFVLTMVLGRSILQDPKRKKKNSSLLTAIEEGLEV